MGRAKLAMEYIKKDKSRSTTFEKRKKGLKKKAQELATLCDVPLCVLIYQGPDSQPDTFPADRGEVLSVIDRYVSVPREESAKRNLNLQALMETKKKAADKQLSRLQGNNNSNKLRGDDQCFYGYPTWSPNLEGLDMDQLSRLAVVLDDKMKAVEERMECLRAGFGDYSGNCNAIVTANGAGMQWPMCGGGFGPSEGTSYGVGGGKTSGGGSVASWPCYDPNVLMGPNFYCGQVGPHGGDALAAKAGHGGSSEGTSYGVGGGSVASWPCYDPNVLMGPNFYCGQVGPHGAGNAGPGGSKGAQPMSAVYGGSVRFEPHQMAGSSRGLMWCEDGRFML